MFPAGVLVVISFFFASTKVLHAYKSSIVNIRLEHIKATNLNLLVYFAVLSEERNISRAAKRLALSQPSMSRALQQFGVELTTVSPAT
jgi:hypothetical protein